MGEGPSGMNTCNRQSHQKGSWYLVFFLYPVEALSFIPIITETSQHCFPGLFSWDVKHPGPRENTEEGSGGRVVGPKPGACADGKKPTARQLEWQLYSVDSTAIAQRHGLWGRRCHIITSIGSVGVALPCSTGGHLGVGAGEWEPLRFLVAILVRESRAEWRELTSEPVDGTERNGQIFAHQARWKLNRS